MEATNFETFIFPDGSIDACFFNTSLNIPCRQGSVSVIGVDARSVGDVQAAVKFAADHNLRLAVKNTGHDYLGRSNARGSFVIWTHHLKNITMQSGFRPAGAPLYETYDHVITLGAGVQWHEAYDAADANNRTMVGGIAAGGSVGSAGGWLLGGGHSALSPTYGLGVDNVLEISLVTSTGEYLTANAHQHPDLFWALRGGGGGTFGVVTSLTYRTHETLPVVGAFLVLSINTSSPSSNPAFQQIFSELLRITPNLTDEGWGGFGSTGQIDVNTFTYTIAVLLPNATQAAANASILPYFDFVRALAANASPEEGSITVEDATTRPFASFLDWYDFIQPEAAGVGSTIELGSWLIPAEPLEENPAHVANTLLTTFSSGFGLNIVAGGAVSRVDPDSVGLNPAWRKARMHVVVATLWPKGSDAGTIGAARKRLQDQMVNLRALAPHSGAYFNEASLFEPNPRQTFFGSHYDRLREIKRVYDPLDLFVVVEGVGADEWDKELKCRLR
ncbi:hypothetical protein C8Q77DRAFT_1099088 [Trametes polyzona]|nr:hypothetical protein C8Q77DRAFT_1099088 [Trametes polyzona]